MRCDKETLIKIGHGVFAFVHCYFGKEFCSIDVKIYEWIAFRVWTWFSKDVTLKKKNETEIERQTFFLFWRNIDLPDHQDVDNNQQGHTHNNTRREKKKKNQKPQ